MLILGLSANWSAISSIASTVAAIIALFTVFLSIKNNKNSNEEKQFSVQPWFHVTSMSRMGTNAPITLGILNDAASTIRIDKINLVIEHTVKEISFKYLKKDDRFTATGKVFEVQVLNDNSFFGKDAFIEIHFTNLYNNQMKAISPKFKFVEKIDNSTLLYVVNENFLYIPFKNELIK